MASNRNTAVVIVGIVLIVLGSLSLFGRITDLFDWGDQWPLIIIGVGVAFFVGMVLGGKPAGGLAVPGSIIITVGLILLVMNITDRWEAWSYAWALIICGIGVGVLINGSWSERPEMRKSGLDTLRAGVILFLIFGVIMEFIFSVTGVSEWGNLLFWGIILALLGLALLVMRVLRLGKPEGAREDLFWPILMIGVGVITSLVYLGWLPTDNLWMLVNLWPVLLIVAGLGIIFRTRSAWLGAALGVLVVAALFVVAFAGDRLGLKAEPFWEAGIFQIDISTGERVVGSGNVITENRPVSGFDRVTFAIPGDLHIQQGASESLTVTGEDNILAQLVTEVRGDRLVIRLKSGNIITKKPVQVTLTVEALEELENTSSGDVTVGPLTTGDFRLELSSSGSIEIEQIQADRISATISSSGDIRLKGNADRLGLRVSSSGNFEAGDLQLRQADVGISSSGNVRLWVLEELQVDISSSGNVSYYGNPQVDKNLSSSGDVVSLGNK